MIGLIVGHNERNKGATNYLDEHEFTWAKRVAYKMKARLDDFDVHTPVIQRPWLGSYREEVADVLSKCQMLNVDFTIHLHFNSFSKPATGCEVLTCEPGAERWANLLAGMISKNHNVKLRHDEGVHRVKEGHRGFMMLNSLALSGRTSIIVEPCFGNFRTKESMAIFENEDAYVETLTSFVRYVHRAYQRYS